MDDDQYRCRQTFNIELLSKRFTPRVLSSRPDELDINFNFYCKVTHSRWALQSLLDQDSMAERWTLLGHDSESLTLTAVCVSTALDPKALCHDEITKQAMEQKLEKLDLAADRRRDLIDDACERASEIIAKSRRPESINNYVMDVYFVVTIEHDHIFIEETDEVDDDDGDEMSADDESQSIFMIPTEESTIRSLKKKVMSSSVDYTESIDCSICLEELSDGCEALCMPCSHVFHDNCIIQWLRTSHYCPTCRFQMPTS